MNKSNIVPGVPNEHSKLFIINTYYINSTWIRSYFMRNGKLLRFFPEHMESAWFDHFVISESAANEIANKHKYRHSFGLQLPDSEFCSVYYSLTRRRFLSTHYYRKYHPELVQDMSLKNIEFDLNNIKENDNKIYSLRRFIEFECQDAENGQCVIQENQINCCIRDRIELLLEWVEKDQINLLAYVLKLCSIQNKYSIIQLYQDIDHFETKHLRPTKCSKLNLACWSLRRYTRSDKDYFSATATANLDHTLGVVIRQLDILHCDIFHIHEKRRNFRRMYVDHSKCKKETVQDLLNYITDEHTQFDDNKQDDEEIRLQLQKLFKRFHITSEILNRALPEEIEELICAKSDIKQIESKISTILKVLLKDKHHSTEIQHEFHEQSWKQRETVHKNNNTPLPLYDAEDADVWLKYKNRPKHNNLESELLCNSICHLDEKEFTAHIADCKAKYQHKQFNVERLSITDILALSSFTDFDRLQKIFSQCYWNKEFFPKRNEFYHWANKLKQAMHYIGKKSNSTL
eukprot:455216_1